jgi:hypothetical protein
MTTVNHYKIYCNTENKFVSSETSWGTVPISTCPTNSSHSVNALSVQVIESISDNSVIINEKSSTIGNAEYVRSIVFSDVATATTATQEIVIENAFALYSISFVADDTNNGDQISIIFNPDTDRGNIIDDVDAKSNTFIASADCMAHLHYGQHIVLDDGTNVDDIGYVIAYDTNTQEVTVSGATVHAFLASNTNILTSDKYMDSMLIGPPSNYAFGTSAINKPLLPSNTTIHAIYKNNAQMVDLTDSPKTLIIYLTYMM